MKNQPNNAKTTVYVSGLLKKRHRRLVTELKTILDQHGVRLIELSGTADIWIRDYAPIQRNDGTFVSYTYRPDYLKGYPSLVTAWKKVKGLPAKWTVEDCGLILDGGNVVLHDRSAIVTTKIFTENPNLSPKQVEARLRESFHLEKLLLIPPEPGDVLGHADGVLAWTGPGRVIVNDYRQVNPTFGRELKAILRKSKIEFAEVPYAPVPSRQSIPPAIGVYTNLLVLPKLVLLPVYNAAEDEEAFRPVTMEFPQRHIVPIDCRHVAVHGGSIHCVTSERLQ